MIEFLGVSKRFGPITALKDISVKIEKGEFVFVTGHSGAGKSTLIRLLVGEYLPSSGDIIVNGEKINHIPKRKLYLWRRKIGVVFQDYKLFSDFTVYENVMLPLQIQNLPKEVAADRVKKILDLVGLTERANLFPAQLAGGESQRVTLARAVVTAPEILLADEPTGNLDPTTAKEMLAIFQEINKSGTTVIMATHDQELVDLQHTRVVELEHGAMVRDEASGNYVATASDSKVKKTKSKEE